MPRSRLGLKLNLQKSAVDISDKRKFLGFNLYHYHEGIRIRIAPQAIERFKIRIREITSRSNGQNINELPRSKLRGIRP